MLYFLVPGLVRRIGNCYKDLFALGGIPYPLLCAYIAMFVLGFDSLCGLIRACPWCLSVSTLSQYLQGFDQNTMNRTVRRMRGSVLRKIRERPSEWIFVFDTTRNPKRTQGLSGQGKWGDSGGIFEGRNLLVLSVVNVRTGKTLPVDCRPCIKQVDDSKNGKSAWRLSLDVLDEVLLSGFPKLPVVFDSWFDCHEFMKELDNRQITFEIELKSMRNVKINIAPRAKNHKINSIFSESKKRGTHVGCKESFGDIPKGLNGMRFIAAEIVHITHRKHGHMALKVAGVFNHPKKNSPFACYATNDLSKSGLWLWQMSRCRWNIEVLFRNLKQNLAWGRFASQGEEACNASIIIPLIIVVHLELKNDGEKSIGTLLAIERQYTTIRSMDFILKNKNHGLIKIFKNRIALKNANQKPVNTVAETNFNEKPYCAA